jgi:hypothetical protein
MIQINLSSKSIAIDGSDNLRVWLPIGNANPNLLRRGKYSPNFNTIFNAWIKPHTNISIEVNK